MVRTSALQAYGVVALDSLIISLPTLRRTDWLALYKKYGKDGIIDFRSLRWTSIPSDDREHLLSEQHELDHYTLLTSTPAGGLLWRLHQVVVRDVVWIAGLYDKHGVPIRGSDVASRGLVDWLKVVGLARLQKALSKEPTNPDSKIAYYVEEEVIVGLANSLRLLDILTCEEPATTYHELTAGELARLLDDTFGYLARRSDVELVGPNRLPNWRGRWVSVEPNAPVFPDDHSFNLRGLLELLAYSKERQYAKLMGARPSDLKSHLRETVPLSLQRPLATWLRHAHGDEAVLRNVLIEGLLGRLDIATVGDCLTWDRVGTGDLYRDVLYRDLRTSDAPGADGRQVLRLESEWPFFRCERLRRRRMQTVPQLRPVVTLATAAGRNRLYGPESHWERPIQAPDEASRRMLLYGIHLRRTEAALRAGMGMRYKSILTFASGAQGATSSPDYAQSILLFHTLDQFHIPRPDGLEIPEIVSAVFFGLFNQTVLDIASGDADLTALRSDLKTARTKLARTISRIEKQLSRGGMRNSVSTAARDARHFFTLEFFERQTQMRLRK